MIDEVRYERVGAAAVSRSTASTGATPSTARPPSALHEATALRGRRRRARAGAHRRGRRGVLRRRRPEGDRDVRARLIERRGPDGLHAPDAVQADDRRDLRLLPRRRPRARAVVRPAHRHRGARARLPRAPLGRAADRRRHAAPAADRRARPRARPDPHRAHRSTPPRRWRWACSPRSSPPAPHLERALELAEGLAALPAGDDARRPPRRDRGLRPAARRRARARGPGRARGLRRRGRGRGPLRRRRGPRRRGRRASSRLPASAQSFGGDARWPTSSPAPPASSGGTWSSGCSTARGRVYVLVREGSRERLDDADRALGRRGRPRQRRVDRRPAPSRCSASSDEQVAELRGKIDHFFHLAAVYDMTRRRRAQRRRSTSAARATPSNSPTRSTPSACTTSPRSPSPATTRACSREDMFDEGQKLPSPYHRTKFESERIVREQPYVPWRVYRPAIVVGDSQTGEMDKIDGPYYFFKAIQRRAPAAAASGSRWSARTSATRTSCRSTGSPTRWTTSPTSPTSTARPSTSTDPRRQRVGRADQRVRRAPRTRRSSRCASTSA